MGMIAIPLQYKAPHSLKAAGGLMWTNLLTGGLLCLAVMITFTWVSDEHRPDLFDVWVISPIAAMTAVAYLVRGERGASIVVLVGFVILIGSTVLAFYDVFTSHSSTSALEFIVMPILQWIAVGIAGTVAIVMRLVHHPIA